MDHVSAYALIVEDGTALARRVARGELPAPDDDVAAARYELIDDVLVGGGPALVRGVELGRRRREAQCRHNLGYWLDGDWWGLGPGAHSHLAGARWWNVKHPARYAALLAAGESPEAGREELTDAERADRAGDAAAAPGVRACRWTLLDDAGRAAAAQAAADGLLDPAALTAAVRS